MTITPPATVKWLLLEACTDSLAQSHDIDLPIDYTGQQVMEEFRKISKYDNIPRHIGLKLPTLSIATVSPFTNYDIEAQRPSKKIIKQSRVEPELTEGFRNPILVSHMVAFALSYAENLEGSIADGTLVMQHGLLIKWNINHDFVFKIFAAAPMLCIGLGILVGALSKHAEIGIALAAAMLNVIQLLLATLLFAISKWA